MTILKTNRRPLLAMKKIDSVYIYGSVIYGSVIGLRRHAGGVWRARVGRSPAGRKQGKPLLSFVVVFSHYSRSRVGDEGSHSEFCVCPEMRPLSEDYATRCHRRDLEIGDVVQLVVDLSGARGHATKATPLSTERGPAMPPKPHRFPPKEGHGGVILDCPGGRVRQSDTAFKPNDGQRGVRFGPFWRVVPRKRRRLPPNGS